MFQRLLIPVLAGVSLLGADLKPGMPAPTFEALDQSGDLIRLADFQGKSVVVLYFYPKDGTPGCTAEACSLRDSHGAILATGAVVLGVSADDVQSHEAFAAKYHLPFSILADPGRKIIDAYGVRVPVVGVAKRWTFIIDRQGIIRHVITNVEAKGHDQQVLALLQKL